MQPKKKKSHFGTWILGFHVNLPWCNPSPPKKRLGCDQATKRLFWVWRGMVVGWLKRLDPIGSMIHVWYIFTYIWLIYMAKCKEIYHTWIVWVCKDLLWRSRLLPENQLPFSAYPNFIVSLQSLFVNTIGFQQRNDTRCILFVSFNLVKWDVPFFPKQYHM